MTSPVYVPVRMESPPVVGLVPVSLNEANGLLEEWEHYLGPVERPFRSQSWVLDVMGDPVAVAVSCTPVSAKVAGQYRLDCVELARLAARDRAYTRVMLRLWREVCGPAWRWGPYVSHGPKAAIAYSQNSRHEGAIYRFDGWTMVTDAAGSSGGGTYSSKRGPGDAVHGKKRLWVWRYNDQGGSDEG